MYTMEGNTEVVSSFFSNETKETSSHHNDISDNFLTIIDELNIRLNNFNVPRPVQYVYNSTIYARTTFELYVRKYCNTKKQIMYFGMNPGPFGMSQTGVCKQFFKKRLKKYLLSFTSFFGFQVPFGEVNVVRNWLQIDGPVSKPTHELKTRPVMGFDCTRSEVLRSVFKKYYTIKFVSFNAFLYL